MAFLLLFSITKKGNYVKLVIHFLIYIEDDSHFQELFKYICSINLIHSEYYFTFDKVLKRFGIKFIKQNIKKKTIDIKELKL